MADNRQSNEISILAQLSEGNSGDASSSDRAAAEKRSKPAGSRSMSSKQLSAMARRFHRDVAVGYEQQVHALEAEKDRDSQRSSHEIDYLNKAIKQLRNAEERYMAEEEDDATKTEELKRQLAIERRAKNELQARTGVVVVLDEAGKENSGKQAALPRSTEEARRNKGGDENEQSAKIISPKLVQATRENIRRKKVEVSARQRLGNDIALEGTGVSAANDRKRNVDSYVTCHDDTRTERSSAVAREAQPEARKRTRLDGKVTDSEGGSSEVQGEEDLFEDMLIAEVERNKQGSQWTTKARELMKYRDENGGRCDVPRRHPSLGKWVSTQRKCFKNSKMSAERIKILDALGFVWNAVDKRGGQQDDGRWNERLEELNEYKKEHGDCLVPTGYNDNPKLGTWVNTQRTYYQLMKKRKTSQMTEERVQKLKAIGFVWKAKVGVHRR